MRMQWAAPMPPSEGPGGPRRAQHMGAGMGAAHEGIDIYIYIGISRYI